MEKDPKTVAVEALFERAYSACVQAHELRTNRVNGEYDLEEYNRLVGICNDALKRLNDYGRDFLLDYYLAGLKDERPVIRYITALWMSEHFSVDIALPVLLELAKGDYKGYVSFGASNKLEELRDKGIIDFS